MKKCKICSEEKPLTEYSFVDKKKEYYKSYCKKCTTLKAKKWTKNNPEQKKLMNKKWSESVKDGHFSVYLLPDHNYVGQTSCMYDRMNNHRSQCGRNVNNVRILYTTKCRDEALELEELLHDMGYEGKHPSGL